MIHKYFANILLDAPWRWQGFALLLLGSAQLVHAQLREITFERLSDAQGLLGTEVHCIYQDKRGFMWFGTERGLNRYDGYSITPFKNDPAYPSSIVNAKVQSLWEDALGTLWVGTWQGLEKFDRASNTFSHYPPNPQAPFDEGTNLIYDLREDRTGTLWLGGNGLMTFHRKTGTFQFYHHDSSDAGSLAGNNVNSIFEDKAGALWIGTGGGLDQIDRSTGKFAHYWRDEKMHSGFFPNWEASVHWIQTIFEDRAGILWLGTNGGPVAFDRGAGTFKHYPINEQVPDTFGTRSVSSICEDDAGVLWIGTWGAGLMTYDARANSFVSHGNDGLDPTVNNTSICSLYRDRSGILWIGTNGVGLYKSVRRQKWFTAYIHTESDRTSLSNNDVRYIYQESSGTIEIGTALGNDQFDRETEVFSDSAAWERPYPITAILRSRSGTCWTGIQGDGINKIGGNPRRRTFYSTRQAGLGGSACSIFEDRRGILWMLVSDAGLCQFDPMTEKFKKLSIGQTQTFVSARLIVEDSLDNTANGWILWIGTNEGLWKYDARVDAFTRFGHNPKDPTSLASNTVNAVFRDSQRALWIGTDRGISRMDSTEGRFESYTDKNGLPDNSVLGVLDDERGHLWVSTTEAISRFDPATKRFTKYGLKEFLRGVRFNAGCCLRSAVGEIYFGGNGGFIIFHPDSIRDNQYVPPIVITGFKKYDDPASLDSAVSEKRVIELSYQDNVFSFEFAALNFTHPEQNQYAYKLEGHDNEWTYCGNLQYARFINVEPGNYTFRVKGSNNDGIWNQEGTSMAVVINPPFWKTAWFTMGVVIVLFVSFGGTIRYVEKRKLQRKIEHLERETALERERSRISQDMHDEVGTSLTAIAILSELAVHDLGNPEEATRHMRQISESTAEVIDNIRQIIWAISPRNDTLDNVIAHLCDHGTQYLGMKSIACRCEIPEKIPQHHLSPETRRNLFLVVKEAVHNIIKHSGATEATIRLAIDRDRMEMMIQDNGKGFVPHELKRPGNGLVNMRKRIEHLGGTCAIESEPGRGTNVKVVINVAS